MSMCEQFHFDQTCIHTCIRTWIWARDRTFKSFFWSWLGLFSLQMTSWLQTTQGLEFSGSTRNCPPIIADKIFFKKMPVSDLSARKLFSKFLMIQPWPSVLTRLELPASSHSTSGQFPVVLSCIHHSHTTDYGLGSFTPILTSKMTSDLIVR